MNKQKDDTNAPLHPKIIMQAHDEAEAALKAADATTLHRLYVEKTQAVVALMNGMEVLAKNRELLTAKPDSNAIAAMRDVALAAIALAKSFAPDSKSEHP